MIGNILMVGLGSCLGGMARYLVSRWMGVTIGEGFPWGTLAVNLLGCFILGVLCGIMERGGHMSTALRLFLTVGFCGGFTTFSTFANEAAGMLGTPGHIAASVGYMLVSLAGGLLMIMAGRWAGATL